MQKPKSQCWSMRGEVQLECERGAYGWAVICPIVIADCEIYSKKKNARQIQGSIITSSSKECAAVASMSQGLGSLSLSVCPRKRPAIRDPKKLPNFGLNFVNIVEPASCRAMMGTTTQCACV